MKPSPWSRGELDRILESGRTGQLTITCDSTKGALKLKFALNYRRRVVAKPNHVQIRVSGVRVILEPMHNPIVSMKS